MKEILKYGSLLLLIFMSTLGIGNLIPAMMIIGSTPKAWVLSVIAALCAPYAWLALFLTRILYLKFGDKLLVYVFSSVMVIIYFGLFWLSGVLFAGGWKW